MIKKGLVSCTVLAIFLFGCNTDNKDVEDAFQNNESEETTDNAETSDESNQSTDSITLPNNDLQKLDEGDAVEQLQQALMTLGFPIEPTGIYDVQTTWAITEIQLQEDDLYINGVYDEQTKALLETYLSNQTTVEAPYSLQQPEHNEFETEKVENPYDVLAVVNKSFSLPSDYEPEDLTVPNVRFPFTEDDPKKQLRKEAADALEGLFSDADQVGLKLFAQSGFRSYDRQEAIFTANVDKHGEDHANTYSAKAGESEHQTGLVMDVTSEQVGFDLVTDFGDTEEGKWLAEHAHEYGFIIRYPEGKEEITKYQYEPWHLRYVGIKAATDIKEKEQTLEEYLGIN